MICLAFAPQVPKVDGYPRKFDCDFCSGCITNFATMGHTFIWGTSASGPYHLNRADPWMDRIPMVRDHCSTFQRQIVDEGWRRGVQ